MTKPFGLDPRQRGARRGARRRGAARPLPSTHARSRISAAFSLPPIDLHLPLLVPPETGLRQLESQTPLPCRPVDQDDDARAERLRIGNAQGSPADPSLNRRLPPPRTTPGLRSRRPP